MRLQTGQLAVLFLAIFRPVLCKLPKSLHGQRDLVVSAAFFFPPFVFPVGRTGEMSGLEIDILDILAARLNFTYRVELDMIQSLPNGSLQGKFTGFSCFLFGVTPHSPYPIHTQSIPKPYPSQSVTSLNLVYGIVIRFLGFPSSLAKGESFMSIGFITLTGALHRIIDFSRHWYPLEIRYMSPKPRPLKVKGNKPLVFVLSLLCYQNFHRAT